MDLLRSACKVFVASLPFPPNILRFVKRYGWISMKNKGGEGEISCIEAFHTPRRPSVAARRARRRSKVEREIWM